MKSKVYSVIWPHNHLKSVQQELAQVVQVFTTKKADCILGYIRKSIASRWRDMILWVKKPGNKEGKSLEARGGKEYSLQSYYFSPVMFMVKFRIQKGKFGLSSIQTISWGSCICILCHFNAMGNWFNFVNRLVL